tara:strand:+ start:673 stop:969 length:297 start_codon:yes stop_codon:yes gene_type:complete
VQIIKLGTTQTNREIKKMANLNPEVEALLEDDMLLWEAIGPDGVDCSGYARRVWTPVDDVAEEIREAILQEDDLELGRLLREQVLNYMERIANIREEL